MAKIALILADGFEEIEALDVPTPCAAKPCLTRRECTR